jgi:hypothetical protein
LHGFGRQEAKLAKGCLRSRSISEYRVRVVVVLASATPANWLRELLDAIDEACTPFSG